MLICLIIPYSTENSNCFLQISDNFKKEYTAMYLSTVYIKSCQPRTLMTPQKASEQFDEHKLFR